jgi:asparagine synthase (glutamine-hydrolysing)
MCGVVGWVGPRAPGCLLETVRQAGRAQRHRGPDDAALLVLAPGHGPIYVERDSRRTDLACHDPELDLFVVVAHQRLAIIDPGPAGAQPMANRDQSVWLTYNGEIYNHVELRAELQRLGHQFAGHSDTEVLLAAYCEWGLGCLPRLAGMFAFALVDRRRGCVVLARDHLGQKPLFTRRVGGGLAFASEIAPLLRVGALPARAALGPTLDYLVTGRTDHRPDTMIEGMQRVDPGTAVVVTGGGSAGAVVHRYWAVPEGSAQDELGVTVDESARQLRELFDRSVQWHLRSDVPVGSLLSGGLDSSAIVLAQRRVGGPALDLSAVSYIGGCGTVSEEPWVDMVTAAARCRTEKLRIDASVWDDAEVAAVHQGEPIAGPAVLVHRALCRRASELGIKVLLDGQGADELLAGYPAALSLRAAGLLRQGRVQAAFRLMVASIASRPRRVAALSQLTARTLRVTAGPTASIGRWPWIGLDRSVVRESLRDPPPPRTLRGAVRRYLTSTLPAVLRWEDRNSMEASVEGRLPFLLPEMVEYCLRLPEAHLVGPAGQTKYVLREAIQDLVPVAVRDRHDKIGLAVPLRAWLSEFPDVDRRLQQVQESPAVSSEWVRDRRSALRSRGQLSGRDVMVLWRLVGFDLWRDALGVSVSW